MSGHPGNQILLILFREFNDDAATVHCLPELFQTLVRFPSDGDIGKDHGTVFGNVPQDFRHFLPIRLIHLKDIYVIDLDQGGICHHRQILHRVGKGPQFKGLAV